MKKIGVILKDARESKSLSLQEVSGVLKINLRTLQAIEDGSQVNIPNKAFLKGFIKSYAQYLKLDVKEVLQIYSFEYGGRPQLVLTNLDMKVPTPPVEDIHDLKVDNLPLKEEEKVKTAPVKPVLIETEKNDGQRIPLKVKSTKKTRSQSANKHRNHETPPAGMSSNNSSENESVIPVKGMVLGLIFILILSVFFVVKSTIKRYKNEAKVSVETEQVLKEVSHQAVKIPETPAPVPSSDVDSLTQVQSPNTNNLTSPVGAPGVPVSNTIPNTRPTMSEPIKNVAPQTTLVEIPSSAETSKVLPPKISNPPPAVPKSKEVPIVVTEKQKATLPIVANEKQKSIPPVVPMPLAKPTETAKSIATISPIAKEATKELPKDEQKSALETKEIIVESLGDVQIEYSDRDSNQTIKLVKDQVHTFKSSGKITIKVSNGGMINLNLNGRDLGKPGELGKNITLTY